MKEHYVLSIKHCTLTVVVLLLLACGQRQEPLSSDPAPTADDTFDLAQIERAGELIALTLSGPDTYYDYQGRHLGLHYLLCEQFASHLGVRLRMELCRDTAELTQRLGDGDADLIAIGMDADSLLPGWRVGEGKPMLTKALREWYSPAMLSQARDHEKSLLTQPRVQRRVFAPMLSKGVISRYDQLFKTYARTCNWDWRLIAAQCYQESTFDPNAQSWAGARGLMQIMPGTADHLGLPREKLTDPEANIEAATRYIKELEGQLAFIHNRYERQNFVLAAYNGGLNHLRDAMRLAERDGRNAQSWSDVSRYILLLSQPQYYQDTLVHHGYMRGSETADYVDKIRLRYQRYKRSVR